MVHKLFLTSWTLNFNPTNAHIVAAPIWATLPDLPLEYWSEDIIRDVVAPWNNLLNSKIPPDPREYWIIRPR